MTTRWCGPELGFQSAPRQKDIAAEYRRLRSEYALLRYTLLALIENGEAHMEAHPSDAAKFAESNAQFYAALHIARAALAKETP